MMNALLFFLEFVNMSPRVWSIWRYEKAIGYTKNQFLGSVSKKMFQQHTRLSFDTFRVLISVVGPSLEQKNTNMKHRCGSYSSNSSHDVLNQTHVPFSSANNQTLGTFFNPMMWWVNIEVPNDSVDKSSWESSTCYPRHTFDPLSESCSTRDSQITRADFRLCLTGKSHNHACLYHYALKLS